MTIITRRTALLGIASISATVGAGAALAASGPVTPDERIEASVAEIRAALQEKFPGWRVQERNDFLRTEEYAGHGVYRDGKAECQAVLIYASGELHGPEEARWLRYRSYDRQADREARS